MPMSRPPAADLVDVVREFLEREILPALDGDRWFHCRVAINLLAMVQRELALAPGLDAEERGRLVELLGEEGSLDALNRELARRIREGTVDQDRDDLIDHLRRTMADALRINNPKWLEDAS